jgi:hypothetical protein
MKLKHVIIWNENGCISFWQFYLRKTGRNHSFLIISILTQMLGDVSGASSYMFFHNLQSNENQRNITLSEQFQIQ